MPYIRYDGPTMGSSAAWAGDEMSREHVLAGGSMLEPSEFTADADGRVFVESGTLVGRTRGERAAGTGFGPAANDGAGAVTDDEVYLLARSNRDITLDSDCTLYRHGSLVYESALPASVTGEPANLEAVRDLYEVIA